MLGITVIILKAMGSRASRKGEKTVTFIGMIIKKVIIMAHQMTDITSDHRSGGQGSRIEGNHRNAYKTLCFLTFWHNNNLKKVIIMDV